MKIISIKDKTAHIMQMQKEYRQFVLDRTTAFLDNTDFTQIVPDAETFCLIAEELYKYEYLTGQQYSFKKENSII